MNVPRIGSINTDTDITIGGNHFNTPLIPVCPTKPGPNARYATAGSLLAVALVFFLPATMDNNDDEYNR